MAGRQLIRRSRTGRSSGSWGLERAAGRQPRDTRYEGASTDTETPPRLIEVKSFGMSNRGYDLWLEVRQVEGAKIHPDYCGYVVKNVR